MEKSVLYQARELSPEKRRAAEELLGVALDEDEVVLVRTSKDRILKPALTGQARDDAFAGLARFQQEMQRRVEGVPEAELDAAIDEAVDLFGTMADEAHSRHRDSGANHYSGSWAGAWTARRYCEFRRDSGSFPLHPGRITMRHQLPSPHQALSS